MKLTIILLLVSFLFFSCSGTKPLMKSKEVKNIETTQLLDTLYEYYGDYSSFSARFTAEVITARKSENRDKKTEVKGTIRIKKDSIIWLSISPLMVEVVRCKFTPDSLYFLNKVDKEYYAGDYSLIRKITGYDINFKSMQSILLNELCMYPFNESIDTAREIQTYNIKKVINELVLNKQLKRAEKNSSDIEYVFDQIYKFSLYNFRLNSMQLDEITKQSTFSVEYKNFNDYDSLSFPDQIFFSVKNKSSKFKLNLQYDKVEFNPVQNYPFRISSRYKKWNP